MAYLDGELASARAAEAVAHLERCGECQLLAEELRGVSRGMAAWEAEGAEFGLRDAPDLVVMRAKRRWWVWGVAAAAAVVVVVTTVSTGPRRPAFDTKASNYGIRLKPQFESVPTSQGRLPSSASETNMSISALPLPDTNKFKAKNPGAHQSTPQAPLIARTAEITIVAPDFAMARTRLETIVAARMGFSSHMIVYTTMSRTPSMDGTISILASQLDATLSDLRKLGKVENESQTGTDVTTQTADLEARLSNERNTEKRLIQLVADRSGGLKDVLAVEVELGRVRGEIESMEAQGKSLATQVERSTITVHISEEERQQLGSNNIGLRLRNAGVEGLRSMRESLIDTGVLIGSRGPVVLLWVAILFFPVRFAWRRWRRRTSN